MEEELLTQDGEGEQESSTADGCWLGNECFPMGYCWETQYEAGWLDLGCGPTLIIDINYYGHNSDPSLDSSGRLTPSLTTVTVDAPTVYFRVFGFLARDLLCLKVNSTYRNTYKLNACVSRELVSTLLSLSWKNMIRKGSTG